MSRANTNVPPISQTIENVIEDQNGDIVAVFHMDEQLVSDDKSCLHLVKRNQSREAGGMVWNPADALRKEAIHVGICDGCRHPRWSLWGRSAPSSPLVTLPQATTCVKCGALLCPKHRREGADGKHRCSSCHRWYFLGRIARWVCFRKVRVS